MEINYVVGYDPYHREGSTATCVISVRKDDNTLEPIAEYFGRPKISSADYHRAVALATLLSFAKFNL